MSLDIKQLEDQCREARLAYEAHLESYPIQGTEESWITWATTASNLQRQLFDVEMKLLLVRFRGVATR